MRSISGPSSYAVRFGLIPATSFRTHAITAPPSKRLKKVGTGLDSVDGQDHVRCVSLTFLTRILRGFSADVTFRVEVCALRALLVALAAYVVFLGLPPRSTMGDQPAPTSRFSMVTAAVAAEVVPLSTPGAAGLKHLGSWLGASEEGEEKEQRNDGGAEDMQPTFVLPGEAFEPPHGLWSNLFGYGLLDTEPRHEWIARLERPPCVRTVAPFI